MASRKRRRPSFLAPLSFGPDDVEAKLQGIPDDFLIEWVREQGLPAANRQQAIGQINYAFGGDVEPVLVAYREWRERAGEPATAGPAARDEPRVGRMVGTVGDTVGDTVGGTVDPAVGETVGQEVGAKAGQTAGEMVGEAVGSKVGNKVGPEVGHTAGDPVGQQVGDQVGHQVGGEAGARVGEKVGLAVGQDVGDEVGGQVGGDAAPSRLEPGAEVLVQQSQPVGKSSAPLPSGESTGVGQVGSVVGEQVADAVGEKVGEQVGNEVGTEGGLTVGKSAGDAVGDAVGAAVGHEVGHEVGYSVGQFAGETVAAEGDDTVGPVVGKAVGRVVGREVGGKVEQAVGHEVGPTVGSGGELKRGQVGQGVGRQVSPTVGDKVGGRVGDMAGALRTVRRAARELRDPRLAAFVRQTDEGFEVVLLGGAERLHLQRRSEVIESKGPTSDQELADWLSERMRVWTAFRAGKGAGLRSQALYLRDYEFELLERLMREFDLAHYKVVGLSAEALAWHVSRGRSVPVSHPAAEVKKRIGVGLLKLPAPEQAGRRRTYDLPDATAALLRALSAVTGRDISAIANLAINALGTVCGLAG